MTDHSFLYMQFFVQPSCYNKSLLLFVVVVVVDLFDWILVGH